VPDDKRTRQSQKKPSDRRKRREIGPNKADAVNETIRKMTRHERGMHAGRFGLDSLEIRIVRASTIAAVILGCGSMVLMALADDQAQQRQTALFWGCLAVGVITGILVDRRIERQPRLSTARREQNEGLARVLHLRVVAAIRVAEFEDSGDAFYLKLDDGRVFFLEGQYLYEPVEKHEFPSAEIEVALSSQSGVVVSLKSIGAYLEPLGEPIELPPPTDKGPYDGTFVDVRFQDLMTKSRQPAPHSGVSR
jgi:hypothetical protein